VNEGQRRDREVKEITMLLTDSGLQITAFDTTMASLVGNSPGEIGANLIVEAGKHQHKRVELWDWFYLLLKAPMKTAARTEFIDTPGMNVDRFTEDIEAAFDLGKEFKGPPPSDLLPEVVSPAVRQMLDRAEALTRDNKQDKVSEVAVTLALLECAGEDMTEFFTDVMDREKDGLGRFKKALAAKLKPVTQPSIESLFDAAPPGKLRLESFSSDGRTFCKRWREDMAAMGIKTKVTTRHLLYSILGNGSGPLANALSNFGVTVKDLHASLTRELTKPGRKRNDTFALTKDAVFDSVAAVLTEALKLSRERDAKGIGEIDIHRAFLAKQEHELSRLMPKQNGINLAAVADYLAEAQSDEEEAAPLQRFSLAEMQDRINGTIFGQPTAVARISPWISRFRFGITRGNRPAGVFLFLGPTGTGKTQLGKELARYVYGSEDEMLFFEMGTFNTKESMNMFIGSPPGYVGYGEGKLTNGLRDHPECVVLFDEIEKADITVFDALLRFADEGKISDPAGPVRDGRKCIIVLTSNAGQSWLREHVKENPDSRENPEMLSDQLFEAAMRELAAKGFRPEFLGRVDERITFVPFSTATCRQIVDGVLKKELPQFEDKGVTIEIPDDVRDILAKFTFDTAMDQGARGAPRAVNTYIISPAIDILSPFQERGDPLPPRLKAVALGKDGVRADGQNGISLEIE
jgi:ATP-dependent Clp protease ATP-binding subunit ClpA